jgi:hypothetical protein
MINQLSYRENKKMYMIIGITIGTAIVAIIASVVVVVVVKKKRNSDPTINGKFIFYFFHVIILGLSDSFIFLHLFFYT